MDEQTLQAVVEQTTQRLLQNAEHLGLSLPGTPRYQHTSPNMDTLHETIATYIDHTLLKPDATRADIEALCEEARQYGFASVCVNPFWVAFCAERLADTPVGVCTVVGFPLGANCAATKAHEAELACQHGATELDMVLNIGALKSDDLETVAHDIAAVVNVGHAHNALVKVIIETALLTDEEKVQACTIAKLVGADFVKTSTGFSKGGATVPDVALMRRVVGTALGVKASGGVRTFADAVRMIEAGATRIGASAGVRIVKEAQGDTSAPTSDTTY